jgi:ribosome-associated protein
MEARKIAEHAAGLAAEMMGGDILVLDLRGRSPLTDFFVLVTANSTVHGQALGREIESSLRALGERPHHVEGTGEGHWVLLDYVDVVVHILLGDVRQYYGLERLWGDAPQHAFPIHREH